VRHIRILNAIRIPQADLKVFVAGRRAVTHDPAALKLIHSPL